MNKRVFFLAALVLIYISGCDQITGFFNKNKNTSQQPKPVLTATAPVATQMDAPLPINGLAKVGNWVLTIEEFNEKLKSLKQIVPDFDSEAYESKKLVLDELIRQQLLVAEAEQTDIAKRKELVQAVEEFKRTLLVREMAAKITQGIEATELEAQEYYNQNKEAFVENGEWHIREIVVYTQQGAKEALIELLKGADFAEMAKSRSKSKSAEQGGDLGYVKEFSFPQMQSAAMSLSIGDMSSVFKGPEGYYIIKLEDKKGGDIRDFAEIKSEIITGLTLMKQQQAVLTYINDLEKKTTVKINESLLKEKK